MVPSDFWYVDRELCNRVVSTCMDLMDTLYCINFMDTLFVYD